MPPFFVPFMTSEDLSNASYESLARIAGVEPAALSERVYSITFNHDGEIWQATVGERMTGKRFVSKKIKGQSVEREVALSDSALVMAIFPGNPFKVVTDGGSTGGKRSDWELSFMAGKPSKVVLFDPV